MLKMMAQDGGKQISYKAVLKKEMEMFVYQLTWWNLPVLIPCPPRKKEMSGDENMVLNHIQTAGNEGP